MTSGPAIYAMKISSGHVGSATLDNDYDIRSFLPAQPWFFGFYYQATRVTGSSTATLDSKMRWWDASGTELTATVKSVTIDASTSGFVWVEGLHVPPANAVRGRVNFTITPAGGTFQHDIYITSLRVAKTQAFADITATVVGPATADVLYDNAGSVFQSADDLLYRVQTAAGTITSGLTASYKVKSGTFNGFTSASGAQALTLTNGVATITPTSMGTASASLEVTFVYNGRTLPVCATDATKVLAAPSSGTGSGGSGTGGAGGTSASQNSGFTGLATGAWGTQTVISATLSFTTGPSQTSVTLAMSNMTNSTGKLADSDGPWNTEYRWQRLISGTWTNVGSVVNTNPDLMLESDPDLGTVVDSGAANDSQTLGSLVASTAYSFRLTANASAPGGGISYPTNKPMTFSTPGGSISVS